jgi:NAD(P)-dependent dehydrogenase (short-subunit alcohol dehydrogenase family)
MSASFDFNGHHVVVLGGTSGINLGIASSFAKAGAAVTVVSRKPENVSRAVATLSSLASGKVHGQCADVRAAEAVDLALRSAVEESGAIDVLLWGAAGNFLCEAKDMSPMASGLWSTSISSGPFMSSGWVIPTCATGRERYQHHCAAVVDPDAISSALRCGKGGRGSDDASARDRMGSGRRAGQCDIAALSTEQRACGG